MQLCRIAGDGLGVGSDPFDDGLIACVERGGEVGLHTFEERLYRARNMIERLLAGIEPRES